MIELSKSTQSDVGRCLQWVPCYLHDGYLATWDTKLLVVDEEVIGGRGKLLLRVFVEAKEEDFVDKEK